MLDRTELDQLSGDQVAGPTIARTFDRLLHRVLAALIHKGMLRVTTAQGHTFTVGDGKGTPVAVRFTTTKAQVKYCSIPI